MVVVSKAIYIVIYSQGKWWVDFEGKAMGPCPDKETAARDAVRIAQSRLLDERPFEIWMALPEGTQRLGVPAMRERYPATPSAQAVAAPAVPSAELSAPPPLLVSPPPVVVAPRSPLPPMSPAPTRLPPAQALL